MIVLDTSILVDARTTPRRSAPAVWTAIEKSERYLLPSLALCEYLRGPRPSEELAAQEVLMPREEAVPLGVGEADAAARLCSGVARGRGRETDPATAASALTSCAQPWSLNRDDFSDIPDLELYAPGPLELGSSPQKEIAATTPLSAAHLAERPGAASSDALSGIPRSRDSRS